MEDELLARVRKELFGNLVHYRQHCMSELDDAKEVLKFIRSTPPSGWRDDVLEEAAKVADEHADGCAMARGNAGAFNDRHAVWQAEAERLSSISIAAAIRALKTPTPSPNVPSSEREMS